MKGGIELPLHDNQPGGGNIEEEIEQQLEILAEILVEILENE